MSSIQQSSPDRPRGERRVLQFGSGVLLRGLIDPILADTAGARTITVVQSTGGSRAAALAEQGGRYTVLTRGRRDGERVDEHRVIDAIDLAIPAGDDWAAVLGLARTTPFDLIVSNTTEAGLALDESDVIDGATCPASFPAKLTAVLLERFRAGDGSAPVVLPCELIQDAGSRLRELCLQAAERAGLAGEFRAWLGERVPFCSTLVDRICTAPPDADDVQRALGYSDAMLTVVEPFAMWAIEAAGPLAEDLAWLAAHGAVTLHGDLAPVRDRKVRILNGSHTASVPLAMLAGHETVLEMVSAPSFRGFIEELLRDELVPFVRAPEKEAFAASVLDRFANPFIRHELRDITAQHSAKMVARLVPTIRDHIAARGEIPRRIVLGIAAFFALARAADDATRDAEALAIRRHWAGTDGDWAAYVEAILRDPGSALGGAIEEPLRAMLSASLADAGRLLDAQGVLHAVAACSAHAGQR